MQYQSKKCEMHNYTAHCHAYYTGKASIDGLMSEPVIIQSITVPFKMYFEFQTLRKRTVDLTKEE